MRRNRPYPTNDNLRHYKWEWDQAQIEGRICQGCKMNIADEVGGLCVGCRNRSNLQKHGSKNLYLSISAIERKPTKPADIQGSGAPAARNAPLKERN